MKRFFYYLALYKSDSPEMNIKLSHARTGLIWGFFITWFFLFDAIFPYPALFETSQIEGTLVGVSAGPRSRQSIRVENDEMEIKGIAYGSNSFNSLLREHIGEPATIWYYNKPQWPFFFERRIVEIEVAGRNQKNNWERIRKSRENSFMKYLSILGIIVIANFAYHILDVLYQDGKIGRNTNLRR